MNKVLIVDDDEQNLVVLQEILESHNYSVVTAVNGAEALEKSRLDPPDLIVSDILMPVMDGFTLCHEWKGDELLKEIPFVVYSSEYTDEKDEDLALKLGVDRFIRKPIAPENFMEIMHDMERNLGHGNREVRKSIMGEEVKNKEVFKLYNERLIKKLEQKMLDLKQEVVERKKTFAALQESENQLRALAGRLTEIEEFERKRLAQELHDKVGPNLTALNINMSIMKKHLPSELAADIKSRLADSSALVEETADFIRNVMAELRPQVLDDYGLTVALKWYGERFSERTGITVEVHGEDLTPRLPLDMETAFFRITQEAMTNVVKYAGASRITVNLEGTDNKVRLEITDDGRGFDVTGLNPRERSGWGLVNMKERAQALGGKFKIESSPAEGTRVMIEIKR